MLALGGCGGSAHKRPPDRTVAASAPEPAGAPAPRPLPLAPEAVKLNAQLARLLGAAGPATAASVYDLTTSRQLVAIRDGVRRPPASVEKLYTTVALLRRLGPNARLRTTVLGTGHLGVGGVWHGDLYLRGGGDPTFGDGAFNKIWNLGNGSNVSGLVQQLRSAGIRRVAGNVIGDASMFDSARGGPSTGFTPDVPDFGGQLSALTYDHGATSGPLSPGAFAARQLALTLRAGGVPVAAVPATGTTPPEARQLAVVSSPPLSTVLQLMNVHSDDLFAEMLTKQLGARFRGRGTIAAGAEVISDEIATYGPRPQILDGSGLMRADRSSAHEVTSLLRVVYRTPLGDVLRHSLPVLGVNGTTRTIGVHTPAQGRCIAKTGTLDYVTNLAGYCRSDGGHMLTFALFIDGPSNEPALTLISKMAAAIAAY